MTEPTTHPDDDLIMDDVTDWHGYTPTHPLPPTPPTPPTARPTRFSPGGGPVVSWLGRVWVAGPGRLGPAAWWLILTGRRHPFAWLLLTVTSVVVGLVTWGDVVFAVCVVTLLAWGENGLTAIRRDRIASLQAVGQFNKHRRRVRQRWVKMWSNAGLVRPALDSAGSKRMPELKGVVPHPDGITVLVAGELVAVGVREVQNHAHEIVETVGAKSLRVTKPQGLRRHLIRRSDLLSITVRFRDPFPRRPISLGELPAPSASGKVVIGLDEEHRGLEKSLFLPSLIVGAPGSGKSTEVWTTLKALRTAGIPFRLRVFDPKGGLELGDLEAAAFRYESMPHKWPAFLAAACEALRVRQEIMKKKSRNGGISVRKIVEPDEEFPLDLMVIDELVTVLGFSRGQEAKVRIWGHEMSAKEAFTIYLSQIRATLGSCIALSQLGEKNVLGSSRAMFPYVSCLRVGPTEKELVDILLGQGAHNAYPAHELDPSDEHMAGRGWVRTKAGVIAYRAAFMDDAERAAEAKEIEKATAKYRARGQRDPEVQAVVRQSARGGGRRKKAASAASGADASAGQDSSAGQGGQS